MAALAICGIAAAHLKDRTDTPGGPAGRATRRIWRHVWLWPRSVQVNFVEYLVT
jgi:hypothetical protein